MEGSLIAVHAKKTLCISELTYAEGESPPACLSAGEECENPDAPGSDDADDGAALPPCCDGLQCCACGPPVLPEDFVPPPFGTCRETCVCPIG